jgi:hypothetical protein
VVSYAALDAVSRRPNGLAGGLNQVQATAGTGGENDAPPHPLLRPSCRALRCTVTTSRQCRCLAQKHLDFHRRNAGAWIRADTEGLVCMRGFSIGPHAEFVTKPGFDRVC